MQERLVGDRDHRITSWFAVYVGYVGDPALNNFRIYAHCLDDGRNAELGELNEERQTAARVPSCPRSLDAVHCAWAAESPGL